MSFLKEFKNFAIKGNMIDMAVGIVIGTAFNNVVSTIVKKVVMPPLSLLTEGVKLSDKEYVLREASEASDEVAIGYGELMEVLIDFLIISFTIFVIIKFINRFKTKSENPKDKTVETPKNIQLLSNIEKLLEEQNSYIKNKGAKD
ncbi:large-conductance mechanosensitive channel protein MscL [Aequorivita sp. 609]|uniref:Large-conductance mechanosensitive channel n=1 Tax=Aequorivita xiaoshiensis TaxID=2874476 RepID=A0A9X1U563_9FLAO|nr:MULTISPECIES: large-conductance mechanosensitive channel protein MscL [Aequorivita]MBB6680168.1 large-conductance mechanosensitive channel protein MscL [Aequorivita sp. 609]MCG2430228.1 large-conductance mechanosensitive channel protein MscL [Aequorivita xiaoshiensis]